jgi:glycosyltransferase involved in cell wall biosynthesis
MSTHKKIRVLETIRQGQIGGGESHLLDLVENLNKDLFEPVVLSFTEGPMVERLQQMNIPVHVIYTEKPFDFTVWPKVKQFLIDQKIEMVHAHGTRANSNVLTSARALKLPIVYTIHGWSFHDDQNFLVKKFRILGEKYLTNRTNINISVSQSNQDAARKFFSEFKSVIIPYGINQVKFNPKREFKDIRAELGIPKDVTLVLFLARFTVQKQPLIMLKAFAKAAQQDPSLRLLMVGDGDLKQQAVALIEELGLGDKIYQQKFRQDVPDVLACADIYCLPSLWEGLPIGLLEAMSMGKAIVASSVDGTKEVIQHMENGILISVQKLEEELTKGILEFSTNPEFRKKCGDKAFQTVSEHFNAPFMTRKVEKLYLELMGR